MVRVFARVSSPRGASLGLAFAAAHRRGLTTLAAAQLTTPNGQPIEQLAHDLCRSSSTLGGTSER